LKIKFILLILLLTGCIMAIPGPARLEQMAASVRQPFIMVIDPGHGGPDGGAEAADGTQEQDINLSIAKAMKHEAEKYGIEAVLTRENREGLYEQDNISGAWKKLGDLKERKRIIEEAKADLVVSIHLNSFWSDTEVRGAQVFYPKGGETDAQKTSMELAEIIQKSLIEGLNDGSNRIEMAKDDIYIFKEVSRPTVLVECGFLSNPQDLKNLKNEKYQKQVAGHIMKAIADQFQLKLIGIV